MLRKISESIRNKLLIQSAILTIPFIIIIIYLLVSMANYNETYDDIVSSMTVANNYNLNFKENMDESLYKIVVGYTSFRDIKKDQSLQDPYAMIDDLRKDFGKLSREVTDDESKMWLRSLLRNINTLEKRIDDVKNNINDGGAYTDNISMLDSDIYIMTELIQEDIQHYIFCQTESMGVITENLHKETVDFIVIASVMLIILTIMVTMGTYVTVSGIMEPVNELHVATSRMAEGDFEARARISSKDELAALGVSFNKMAESMEALIEEIKEDEQKMRRMDLRLLQEQINPHFLYNTLDTIVWLIESNETDDAVEMVVTLSNFFRTVLSKGKEMITIKEEEQHIKNYLDIQKMRYGDIMEYNISMDAVIYDYKIHKLTLQPIIENALYHGIKYKRAKGYVHVTGEKEGNHIRLRVRDNGVGMDEDELLRLRESISKPCRETDKGFGLANVNERIKNYYGTEYGISIYSTKGKGTIVEVTIPAIKAEEEGDGVE